MKMELKQMGETADLYGPATTVSVLIADGIPVALIHSTDRTNNYNDDRKTASEHVIQALQFKTQTGKYDKDDVHYATAPSRSSRDMIDTPVTVEAAWEAAQDDAAWNLGYNWIRWAPKGATVPEDARPAFFDGVKRAQERNTNRKIRAGKITGEPPKSSW